MVRLHESFYLIASLHSPKNEKKKPLKERSFNLIP